MMNTGHMNPVLFALGMATHEEVKVRGLSEVLSR